MDKGVVIVIEILPESRDNILAIKGTGKLTQSDYEDLLIPRLKAIIEGHSKARLLFHMDEGFRGWDANAAWNYAKFGLKYKNAFDKVAAVCGPQWVHWGMKLKALFVPAEIKSFSCNEQTEAWNWLRA